MKKICVIFGGNSYEHNISCESDRNILNDTLYVTKISIAWERAKFLMYLREIIKFKLLHILQYFITNISKSLLK